MVSQIPDYRDEAATEEPAARRAWANLSGFQRECMGAIASFDDAVYGLELRQYLEGVFGEDINHGRLYPNLDALVASNLVDKSERDGRTNDYQLTQWGERVLNAGADRLDEVRTNARHIGGDSR